MTASGYTPLCRWRQWDCHTDIYLSSHVSRGLRHLCLMYDVYSR
jgi:hypothetical protein